LSFYAPVGRTDQSCDEFRRELESQTAPTRSNKRHIAREDRKRDNHNMFGWIATGIVVMLVVLLVAFRLRRSSGHDFLGSVSERWLADERGASRSDLQ
jgi:hypothetical protein